MREKYIAPDVYYEKFELSRSIAAGCSDSGIWVATWLHDDLSYFTSAGSMVCSQLWEDENPAYEGFCYWQGADEFKLMTS